MKKINFRKIILIVIFLSFSFWFWTGNINIAKAQTIEELLAKIAALQNQIAQLQRQLTELTAQYKCPDLNGDGIVNILDLSIISKNFNSCKGDSNYDQRGDADGDNCLTATDLDFVSKYFGKRVQEIPQCPKPSPKPESEYKCPDLNGDGIVNILDVSIISKGYNTCQGEVNYDPRGDLDGDNCLTSIDLNFLAKYFSKKANEISQCPRKPIKPESEYKCPDLNGDGTVTILDVAIISKNINKCQGESGYDLRGDVDYDNCLTAIDLDFVSKYFGKRVQEIPQCPKKPAKPESEYKCPDLNGDGIINILDIAIVSKGYNTCQGEINYDSRGDVDGDNCLTSIDLNFVSKYFGKRTEEITQCPKKPAKLESEYKCPDLNSDGIVNILDITIVSKGYNTCQGEINYDSRGDVDGDNCLTSIDLNFVSKYFGKKIGEITQCKILVPPKPESEYKCPDLNGDGIVDIIDTAIISKNINKCQGDSGYDSRGDVDGDNCLTTLDQNYVSKYFDKKSEEIAQCKTIKPTPPLTLSVALSANPSSGTAPLTGVDLTADVSGTATGYINYTFYCNRSDNGTNVTPGWCHKRDSTNINPYTVIDCCNFSSAGTFTAKIIVERGTLQAESRINIQVNLPSPPPKPESEYKCPDLNGDGIVDIIDTAIISKNINKCQGDSGYDSRGDVNGDNCSTMTDLDFVSKYFGKKIGEITQCPQPIKPTPAFDFSLSVSPSSASVTQGGSTAATVTAALISGTTQQVSFSVSGLPSGVSASFSPANCYPTCLSAMTINISSTTPTGTYTITINGAGGGKSYTAVFALTVQAKTISESEYKCPDVNGDGKVDVIDIAIVSRGINTCTGQTYYDARGDFDGDNCLTNTDLNFVSKYFGKSTTEITQCKGVTLKYMKEMLASIANAISQIVEKLRELRK
jgi:hypothetical protein